MARRPDPSPPSAAPPAQAQGVPGRGRFEEIYDEMVVPIYRFVFARVGNRPDAEDLTAQVFMRAVEQLDTSRDHGQIASWLYRVAQNAIADYWRAFYRLPLVASDDVAPGWEPVDSNEPMVAPTSGEASGAAGGSEDRARQRLDGLLRRLPENYRRVLELRFLQRLSVAETAEQMGITRGNAKVLQYRALRKAALLEDGADG